MDTFGGRLKSLRFELNMSQEELAQKLGTSKQVISRYETGSRIPRITVAVGYCEKLGVPRERLLGEDAERPADKKDGGPCVELTDTLDIDFFTKYSQLTPDQKKIVKHQIEGILASYPDDK